MEELLQKSLSIQPGSSTCQPKLPAPIDVVLSLKFEALPATLPSNYKARSGAYRQSKAIGDEAIARIRLQAERLKQQQGQLEQQQGQLEQQQGQLKLQQAQLDKQKKTMEEQASASAN